MAIEDLIVWLVIGGVDGWLAGLLVKGYGLGLIGNIVVGIVGALIAAGPAGFSLAKVMGFIAVVLASVNIFGGFIVTQRMLQMFKKKTAK